MKKACDWVCSGGSGPVTIPETLPCRGIRRKGTQLYEALFINARPPDEADVLFVASKGSATQLSTVQFHSLTGPMKGTGLKPCPL